MQNSTALKNFTACPVGGFIHEMDKDYNFKYLSSEIKIKIIIKFTVNLLLKHYCVDVAFCAVFCIFHPLLFLFPLRFVYGNVN